MGGRVLHEGAIRDGEGAADEKSIEPQIRQGIQAIVVSVP
jgi:hypothetical protein